MKEKLINFCVFISNFSRFMLDLMSSEAFVVVCLPAKPSRRRDPLDFGAVHLKENFLRLGHFFENLTVLNLFKKIFTKLNDKFLNSWIFHG